MMSKEELESKGSICKGEVTMRWDELAKMYEERLNKMNAGIENEERLNIFFIEFTKRSLFEKLCKFEYLSEREKEVFEIYKIRYSGHYVVIIGPISEQRIFEVFDGIDI